MSGPSPRAQVVGVALLLGALAAGFVAFSSYHTDSDVRAIYAANLAVATGASPWDEVTQSALMTEVTGEPRHVLPFGYPPWYVLATLPMGWLPYPQAERLFLVFNLVWLGLGLAWLTRDRDDRERAVHALVAAVYLPVLGLVAVGQMAMPVFAGAALALVGLAGRSPWLLAAAALLLSFKWHVGALPGVAFLVLLGRDRELFTRTVGPLVSVFLGASALGLLLDPRWPATYLRSVLELSVADVNQVCDSCSSLAWTIATRTSVKTSVAGAALLGAGSLAIWGRGLVRDPRAFVAAAIALTLVCLPYVRNYDFVLLAVPLVIALQRTTDVLGRGVIGACWAAAAVVLVAPRTWSDELLGGSALAMWVLLLVQGPREAG